MTPIYCPLCGRQSGCQKQQSEKSSIESWHCNTYGLDVRLGETFPVSNPIRDRALNLVLEFLLRKPVCKINEYTYDWEFVYVEKDNIQESDFRRINLFDKLNAYPDTLVEKIPRILDNIATSNPEYGDDIAFLNDHFRLLFVETLSPYSKGVRGVVSFLNELGYLKKSAGEHCYTITAKGWQEIDSIRRKSKEVRQGFIAMSFRDETKSIRESFRTAINGSGYAVSVIDEKEHNNQIVPEIFYEIERSKFMVVDVTYPNYGAYYEAGYAQALGKQVIICCRENEFRNADTRPHFDISQKSMIVWKDETELIERLKRRIEATVN